MARHIKRTVAGMKQGFPKKSPLILGARAFNETPLPGCKNEYGHREEMFLNS
jgi:hypothetical protein